MNTSLRPSSSEALMTLVEGALAHAISVLRGGESLATFAMCEGDAGRTVIAFRPTTNGEGPSQARAAVTSHTPKPSRYAIGFQGHLILHGVKYKAVLVEAGEVGNPESFVFAQRFETALGRRAFKTVGPRSFLTTEANRLA